MNRDGKWITLDYWRQRIFLLKMLTSAARQSALVVYLGGMCVHVYVSTFMFVCTLRSRTHTHRHTHPHIFCRINTSLLFPITLLFACWNIDGFSRTVSPTLCVLHNQLSYTLFNKVNTGKVRLSSNVNCFHRFAVCFHIKSQIEQIW